jgi:hypothetical protein
LGYWEHLALGGALASATFLTFFPTIFWHRWSAAA